VPRKIIKYQTEARKFLGRLVKTRKTPKIHDRPTLTNPGKDGINDDLDVLADKIQEPPRAWKKKLVTAFCY
jgi:hypothetical protein